MLDFSVVLVEPSHPGNIGAVARAMKTMGFSRLVLVNPKQFPHPDATAFASGATDVLEKAVVVPDLATAIASAQRVVGVSARVRDVPMPCVTPREFASQLSEGANLTTVIVFGNEQSGLSNEDLARCHQQIRIPTAKDYGSLNLAQAVQIVCYEVAQIYLYTTQGVTLNVRHSGHEEWRDALDMLNPESIACRGAPTSNTLAAQNAKSIASQQDFDGMFNHWCDVLEAAHYLHPQQRQKILLRMRQLWLRTQPTTTEITMLRGAFRNILRHMNSHIKET